MTRRRLFLTAITNSEGGKRSTDYIFEINMKNDRISYMLRNTNVEERIVRSDEGLVQKVYPIYAKKEFPRHALDFRSNFYFPEKHLFGQYIDTKVFNIAVIWFMTLVLILTLYFDVLRKILSARIWKKS